jgi:hypothetical protein
MAPAYSYTRDGIFSAMEAQRHQASEAAREQPQVDVLSVYYAVQAKMQAGLVDEAKAIVAAYRAAALLRGEE